jgi:hypothetical protein
MGEERYVCFGLRLPVESKIESRLKVKVRNRPEAVVPPRLHIFTLSLLGRA